MTGKAPKGSRKQVDSLTHGKASRRNIPTAEAQSAAEAMERRNPINPVAYKRANPLETGEKHTRDEDLDPQIIWKGGAFRLTKAQINALKEGEDIKLDAAQLAWRGKDQQDWSDLVVQPPPVYVQEKIHPKHIIEGLMKQTKERRDAGANHSECADMFSDFNGIAPDARTDFYQHDQNWQNRMILGDSLQVMASLAERENMRGKVQCIYFDPPYGIKYNSNWQVSTRSKNVKDGKKGDITREPEQVRAFRDTWDDGIHSYLTYLRDRLTVMRDMLTESGSTFVQIGSVNVHRVRAVMDEVFGEDNFICGIAAQKTGSQSGNFIQHTRDEVLWYARDKEKAKSKFRRIFIARDGKPGKGCTLEREDFSPNPLTSEGVSANSTCDYIFQGKKFHPGKTSHWSVVPSDLDRVVRAGRLVAQKTQIRWKFFFDDYPVKKLGDYWSDLAGAPGKIYVVQSTAKLVQRCILMTTEPGDLVLDPTCGSGTTAEVSEQWGRRWITIDTSRVALALARTRLMSKCYPYYILVDSPEGQKKKEGESGVVKLDAPNRHDSSVGFVYKCAPHVTLKSIAKNTEIDVIWDRWQGELERSRADIVKLTGKDMKEWEIPHAPEEGWSDGARKAHRKWWDLMIKRQKEIDKSIARKAEAEPLYDQPYEDKSKVRVAGPFTVESLSPHRNFSTEGNRVDGQSPGQDFATSVLENLKSAGVQQSDIKDRIEFTAMEGWPGDYIAAKGTYDRDGEQKKAGIFIGPDYGTIGRPDLVKAAIEATEHQCDILIACGFNFDAQSSDMKKWGAIPVLKAKMNPDLHMANELKNTGAGNLFVALGEPDIECRLDDEGRIVVKVLGVDEFDTKTLKVRASSTDDIAAWFIDTDYDEESFFVRQAYFLGDNDPYKKLKTCLKGEIDPEAWATLYRDTSYPFPRPPTGRFAVKVINHMGVEVMKVFLDESLDK